MARVVLGRALRHFTSGEETLEIEARDVRGVVRALEARFPGIAREIESGMAVAIDGEIVADAWLEPVAPEAEVHFVPAISGG